MKYIVILTFLALFPVSLLSGQGRSVFGYRTEVVDGDTIQVIDMMPIYKFTSNADLRKFERLIRNIKKVYPIAKQAEAILSEMETNLMTIKSEKAQKAYVKEMEKKLKKLYTPIIKNMTFSQGKILIKLIDRQTDNTAYALVKELRSGFSAGIWQGLAKLFGMNLKDTYDKDGDDAMIERIIRLYEVGLI